MLYLGVTSFMLIFMNDIVSSDFSQKDSFISDLLKTIFILSLNIEFYICKHNFDPIQIDFEPDEHDLTILKLLSNMSLQVSLLPKTFFLLILLPYKLPCQLNVVGSNGCPVGLVEVHASWPKHSRI